MSFPGGQIPSRRRGTGRVFPGVKGAGGFSEVSTHRDPALTRDLGRAQKLAGLGPCSPLQVQKLYSKKLFTE